MRKGTLQRPGSPVWATFKVRLTPHTLGDSRMFWIVRPLDDSA